jgi:hypothetical protein
MKQHAEHTYTIQNLLINVRQLFDNPPVSYELVENESYSPYLKTPSCWFFTVYILILSSFLPIHLQKKIWVLPYEVVSKILRTGDAIYTAVVVARSTGPNRPKCEFRVILRRFAVTAWKRAKTSPRTLARTDLAASPWQGPVPHFRPHQEFSCETQNGSHSPPTVLPWFGTLWLLLISKKETEALRMWYHWGDPGRIAECLTLWPKRTSRKRSKN